MEPNTESMEIASDMETEGMPKEEDLLQSSSMDDIGGGGSISSSILNSEDEEDGVNITIKEIRNDLQSNLQNPEINVRPKLSGAKKKRFRKLLLGGHAREEALSMVLTPSNVPTPKRSRNMNNSSNSDGKPNPKKQKGLQVHHSVNNRMENIRQGATAIVPENQQSTFGEVAKWVRVGILPNTYPQIQLTTEQMNLAQEAILEKVTVQRRESFKPKFTNCWQRTGHLVINCQDTETADWLDSVVPTLCPWEGAELTVVDADDIPRLDVMIGFFPQSVNNDNDTIRIFIESQNDGLSTDKWRIIQRNTLYEKHVEWYFTVDEASMQHFRASNFLLNYKFGQTTLRKKGMFKPDSNGTVTLRDDTKDEPESSVSTGNQQDHSVPGPSGIHGNPSKVESSKNHNQTQPDINNHQGSKNNVFGHQTGLAEGQFLSEPPKDRNSSGPTKDHSRSGSSKDQTISGHLKGQRSSELSKARSSVGPSKEQRSFGPSKEQSSFGPLKDQSSFGTLKDQNQSGPHMNQNAYGLVRDQNTPGLRKNHNETEQKHKQKSTGPKKDQMNSKNV